MQINQVKTTGYEAVIRVWKVCYYSNRKYKTTQIQSKRTFYIIRLSIEF